MLSAEKSCIHPVPIYISKGGGADCQSVIGYVESKPFGNGEIIHMNGYLYLYLDVYNGVHDDYVHCAVHHFLDLTLLTKVVSWHPILREAII